MSISWSHGRVLADAHFVAAHGALAADGFQVKLSVEYRTQAWHDSTTPPVVRLAPAPVTLAGEHEIFLGYAMPESTIPFSLTQYGGSTHHMHALTLSVAAMERLEARRAGQGIVLRLKLQGEVWTQHHAAPMQDVVECRISQSDWLEALTQSGYGHYLVFEVPLHATTDPSAPTAFKYMQHAKEHFAKGNFDDAVAVCRKALEAVMAATQTQDAQAAAVRTFKTGKDRDLGFEQRELLIRQAVMNLTHLAHHHDSGAEIVRFDRSGAAMVMGMTASVMARMK